MKRMTSAALLGAITLAGIALGTLILEPTVDHEQTVETAPKGREPSQIKNSDQPFEKKRIAVSSPIRIEDTSQRDSASQWQNLESGFQKQDKSLSMKASAALWTSQRGTKPLTLLVIGRAGAEVPKRIIARLFDPAAPDQCLESLVIATNNHSEIMLNLLQRDYDCEFYARGYAPTRLMVRRAQKQPSYVHLEEGRTLTGWVWDFEGQPARNVRVCWPNAPLNFPHSCQVAPNGSFVFKHLPRKSLQLKVLNPANKVLAESLVSAEENRRDFYLASPDDH